MKTIVAVFLVLMAGLAQAEGKINWLIEDLNIQPDVFNDKTTGFLTVHESIFTSSDTTGTAITAMPSCTEDDYKKALQIAKKYLPKTQEESLKFPLVQDTLWIAPEKRSTVIRREADALDKRDEDLKYIDDVLKGDCKY